MALDIEKCKECYYADEDGVCEKCCVDNAAFTPKRPNERIGEWISVKDRLPELIPGKGTRAYSDAVLVWTSGRKAMVAIWDGIDFLCAMDFWEAWGEEITHWMPLPEQPTFEPKKTKEQVSEDVSAVEKCGNSSFRNYFSFIKGL